MIGRRRAALLLALLFPFKVLSDVTVSDDAGRHITLPAYPARIVSLAPGATEMLFAAGAGDKIIATVEFANEPAAARKIPRVGDASAIDIEKLISLRPDIVVIWPGGGNPAQRAKVERLGLPTYHQQIDVFADIPGSLRRLGVLTNMMPSSEQAAQQIERRLQQLEQSSRRTTPPLKVMLEVWNRPLYTVGGKQLMSDALRLCGAGNAFADLTEMSPAVSIEGVLARNPDVIVAIAPPGDAAGWLEPWKRFTTLSAVKAGRLVAFEDQRLSRLGPSAVDGAEALCQKLAVASVNTAK